MASRIIKAAQRGERDVDRLVEAALAGTGPYAMGSRKGSHRRRWKSPCSSSSASSWRGCAIGTSSRSSSSTSPSGSAWPTSTPRSCARSARAGRSCWRQSIGRRSMRFRPSLTATPNAAAAQVGSVSHPDRPHSVRRNAIPGRLGRLQESGSAMGWLPWLDREFGWSDQAAIMKVLKSDHNRKGAPTLARGEEAFTRTMRIWRLPARIV
jgi:hypothetical protein